MRELVLQKESKKWRLSVYRDRPGSLRDDIRLGGAYRILDFSLKPGDGVFLTRLAVSHAAATCLKGRITIAAGVTTITLEEGETERLPASFNPLISNAGASEAIAVVTMVPAAQEHAAVAFPCKVNSIGMPIVKLMPGTFYMGTESIPPPSGNPLQDLFQPGQDEGPRHEVAITSPFGIGMFPVTFRQFEIFVNETGYITTAESGEGAIGIDLATGFVELSKDYSWRHPWNPDGNNIGPTEDHPVVCVSDADARAFCEWLGAKECKTYRLPTEAEWEYACRAGSEAAYSFGDDPKKLQHHGNIADASLSAIWIQKKAHPDPAMPPVGTHLPPYAMPWNDGWPLTSPVGAFLPNRFGLCDLHANVGEWCSDWYDPGCYAKRVGCKPVKDPHGPTESDAPEIDVSFIPGLPGKLKNKRKLRVIRGGVWLDPVIACRSADRRTHIRHPIEAAADVGFRVVLEHEKC